MTEGPVQAVAGLRGQGNAQLPALLAEEMGVRVARQPHRPSGLPDAVWYIRRLAPA